MSYGMLRIIDGKPRVCTTLYHGIWSNDIPVFLYKQDHEDFEMAEDESVLVRYYEIPLDDVKYAFIIEYRVTSNIYTASTFPFNSPIK